MNLLQRRSDKDFYDSWESASPEFRDETRSRQLQQFVDFARTHVPFYSERLDGFNASSSHPFKDVPALESRHLRDLVPPQSRLLLSRDTNDFNVFQSGGTTGFPKTTLFSNDELDGLDLPNARGFFAMGLEESDRTGNLFAVGGLYMTFVHINRMLQQYGCTNFPFSNQTGTDFLHTAVKLYEINTLTGITSVVLNALRSFADYGLEGIQVKKVLYGGEHIYESDIRELREKYGVETIGAPGYGTVDTWYLGYQCTHSQPGTFHTHDDQVYLEIVDEETGELCATNTVGMVYATPWVRTLTPIVRYKVGDLAKWLPEACNCGRTTPRFQLLGRGDDVLRIGYDSIEYTYVQNVVSRFSELSGTVQMIKKRLEGRDQLVIRIETTLETTEHVNYCEKLSKEIVNGRPTLKSHIEKSVIWPVKIELVQPGQIERNPRTGKLVRVVDAL